MHVSSFQGITTTVIVLVSPASVMPYVLLNASESPCLSNITDIEYSLLDTLLPASLCEQPGWLTTNFFVG